jgi:hypothetical protein
MGWRFDLCRCVLCVLCVCVRTELAQLLASERSISHTLTAFLFCIALYGIDIQGPTDWTVFPPASSHVCATPPRIRNFYRIQREVKGYRSLLQKNVTIFGTFDGE